MGFRFILTGKLDVHGNHNDDYDDDDRAEVAGRMLSHTGAYKWEEGLEGRNHRYTVWLSLKSRISLKNEDASLATTTTYGANIKTGISLNGDRLAGTGRNLQKAKRLGQ